MSPITSNQEQVRVRKVMWMIITWSIIIFSTIASILLSAAIAAADDADVRVSSIGYMANRAKHASFVGKTTGEFSLRREDGTVVLTGELRSGGTMGQWHSF